MNKNNFQMSDSIKEGFANRNIEVRYFETRAELMESLQQEVAECETIGIGNSQTLKILDVTEKMNELGKTVYDKTIAKSKIEAKQIKREAMLTDCYISSCNAFTLDGRIVNIDHSGNRVAAMTFGPEKVIIITGTNKAETSEVRAIKRALAVATPKNAVRSKISSPCIEGHSCSTCNPRIRICNNISIIRGQSEKNRMKVFIINEELGF